MHDRTFDRAGGGLTRPIPHLTPHLGPNPFKEKVTFMTALFDGFRVA